MKVNFGFFLSKFFRWLNRPSLRNCIIDKNAYIGTGSNCINVMMGRYSYMGKNNSVNGAKIGSFCSIASYCAIGGNGHNPSMVSTSPVFMTGRNVFRKSLAKNPIIESKIVNIGNDVWIGEGVFIKDGISIGDGAIIGAHSVVTKNVEPYAVVAGAPARLIRYRFIQEEVDFLLKIKWWNFPEEQLVKFAPTFLSIKEFIQYYENSSH
jgi:acetyltransferase-like isoleucine patch superfamily enzyme